MRKARELPISEYHPPILNAFDMYTLVKAILLLRKQGERPMRLSEVEERGRKHCLKELQSILDRVVTHNDDLVITIRKDDSVIRGLEKHSAIASKNLEKTIADALEEMIPRYPPHDEAA